MSKVPGRRLGICYYPEHWPRSMWADDAKRMADAGISVVRIGEFAWSPLEPRPGDLRFEWLDEAIEVLGNAGHGVVLGTPTATPPRWLLDKHPDMLAIGADGRRRGFGSRRHYDFSHRGYREECRRIVQLIAERYGHHGAVEAWQIDNEYGCHNTTLSYSPAALSAFREWLEARYGSIDALNEAWGNVFWSMHYNRFNQIDFPHATVTTPNPAHSLDFRRFASDEVVTFNRAQVDIVRRFSPGRTVLHNYMGRVLDFDHFAVGQDLDAASWNSYPLGFLEDRVTADASHKHRFARQGDPDMQAFHHDLYRAVGKERWWIMEQQPGPVNWAPHNPAPHAGMVRLWCLEAFAHGAEVVSIFRWRQAPFGQEQMHA
ncbi:MAG: beta-galactosidase, partial [Pseudomonadota bacterium]